MKNLFTDPILHYFEIISEIPRGSGNEQEISDWIVKFAKSHSLEVIRDKANNVLIRKKASEGYEKYPGLLLQAHMDMVCAKRTDVQHDFLKDPIDLVIDGDYLRANGTTLGADDGIGVSYMLNILADDSLEHPFLECLFTTGEEVGMTGMKALEWDKFNISSKRAINLDAGFDGVFISGCAGGGDVFVKIPLTRVKNEAGISAKLTIDGLKGGHSGAEIHLGRANAIKLLARILQSVEEKTGHEMKLVSVSGGTQDNVIPHDACAELVIPNFEQIESLAEEYTKVLRKEYSLTDPEITVSIEKIPNAESVISEDVKSRVLDVLTLLPQGIIAFDAETGKVATSSNIGTIRTSEKEITIVNLTRSSVESRLKDEVLPVFRTLGRVTGAEITETGFYPGWQMEPDSKIKQTALDAYKEVCGEEARCTLLHGGLECGLLSGALGGVDMIGMYPEVNGCHGAAENMRISSAIKYGEILKTILKNTKE